MANIWCTKVQEVITMRAVEPEPEIWDPVQQSQFVGRVA